MSHYCESRAFKKAWTANANTSSFASRIPTITEPTNDGVLDIKGDGLVVPSQMLIIPYGLGADDDAADMRVIGWRHAGPVDLQGGTRALWIPTILGEFNCTFSTAVGVAGSFVLNTERFADTITIQALATTGGRQPTFQGADTTGTPLKYYFGDIRIFSIANNLIAYVSMPTYGCEKIEITFDQTTNNPTCNALVAFH